MTLMTTSHKGIDLIKRFEGCRLTAYKDSVGVPTIGYGHTKGVTMGMTITQQQAEVYLAQDLRDAERAVNDVCKNFTQNQFDALVSWIYNLGIGNFKKSTMRKKIVANAKDIEITDEMVRWVNAGGRPLLGLKRRRCAEANMFLGKDVYKVDNSGNIKKSGF